MRVWRSGGKRFAKWQHKWTWEQAHGPVPSGYHVHHKDDDKTNDALSNLELVLAGYHMRLHMAERREENSKRARSRNGKIRSGIYRGRGRKREKLCSQCDEWKPFPSGFHVQRSAWSGHRPECKECHIENERRRKS